MRSTTPARPRCSHTSPIPRRVAPLPAPAPPRRLVLLAVVLALTLLAGACALDSANDLQDLQDLLAVASSY
jgi:hypothetical protein